MNKKINFQHLAMLVAIIFIVFYFVIQKTTIFKKEKFENILNVGNAAIDKKNKSCSQDSINTNIKDYIFSSVPTTR